MIIYAETSLKIAIQIEILSIEYYEKLKSIFNQKSQEYKIIDFLKEEEIKHKRMFEELHKKVQLEKESLININEAQFKKISSIIEKGVIPDKLEIDKLFNQNVKLDNLLLPAIGIELDSLYFFNQIANYILPAEKNVINLIIQEERKHLNKFIEIRYRAKFNDEFRLELK